MGFNLKMHASLIILSSSLIKQNLLKKRAKLWVQTNKLVTKVVEQVDTRFECLQEYSAQYVSDWLHTTFEAK